MYEDKNPYDVFSVKGKTVIVTGGMGFLGRQYVEGFTVAGANVVIFDLKDRAEVDQDLHNICRLSESYIQYHKVDITNKDEVVNAVKQAHQTFKSIDILINNAALNPSFSSPDAEKLFADYETYDIELFRKELDIDVTAMLICAQAVMPYMKQQNSGVIINIASGVANKAYDNRTYDGTQKQGRKKSIAYTTAKTKNRSIHTDRPALVQACRIHGALECPGKCVFTRRRFERSESQKRSRIHRKILPDYNAWTYGSAV